MTSTPSAEDVARDITGMMLGGEEENSPTELEWRRRIATALAAAETRGAEGERGRIVAWLRRSRDEALWESKTQYAARLEMATDIETGSHLEQRE